MNMRARGPDGLFRPVEADSSNQVKTAGSGGGGGGGSTSPQDLANGQATAPNIAVQTGSDLQLLASILARLNGTITVTGGAGGGGLTQQQTADAGGLAPAVVNAGSLVKALQDILARLALQIVPAELPPQPVALAANTRTQIATYDTSRMALRGLWYSLYPGYLGRGSMASSAGAVPVTDAPGTHVYVIEPAKQITLPDATTAIIPYEFSIEGVFAANGIPDAGNEWHVFTKVAGTVAMLPAV